MGNAANTKIYILDLRRRREHYDLSAVQSASASAAIKQTAVGVVLIGGERPIRLVVFEDLLVPDSFA